MPVSIPGDRICTKGHIVRNVEEKADCPYCRSERHMKPDPRAVRRIHKWRWGHDPHDPDAEEGSGWIYTTIQGTEAPEAEPDQRDQMDMGGPESGLPCQCGEMTRIVGERKPSEILVDVYTFDKDKAESMDASGDTLYLLACPRCYRKIQMRKSFLERIRQQKLERL